MSLAVPALRLAAVVAAAAAIFALALFGASPTSPLRRRFGAYRDGLERELRKLHLRDRGATLAHAQAGGVALCLALALVTERVLFLAGAVAAALAARVALARLRARHVRALESQVDGLLVALANALKVTPSLGDAFLSLKALVPAPMATEIALAEKELRLGSTIEDALLAMSERARCERLDTALSAVLIGRQVGGDLPAVLESTAAALREMDRLQGVVRSKTAEGRFQMWVLAVGPLAIVFGFEAISPGYFAPLTASLVGWVIVSVAIGMWLAAILVASKVIQVEL